MTSTTLLENPSTIDIDVVGADHVSADHVATRDLDATTALDQAAVAAAAARRERRGMNIAFGALILGLAISIGGLVSIAWHDSVAANGPHGGPAYAAKIASQTTAP